MVIKVLKVVVKARVALGVRLSKGETWWRNEGRNKGYSSEK